MNCEAARGLLDERAAEAAGPDRRPPGPGLLGHLLGCASCRRLAARQDPTLLFLLAAVSPPPADWRGFEARVRAGIERERREAGLLGRLLEAGLLAPKRLVPAMAAAVVLVAIGLAALDPLERLRGAGPAGSARLPRVPAVTGPLPEAEEMAAVAPSPVESVASPTARIVHVRIGDQAEPSDVVLILDEGIDL